VNVRLRELLALLASVAFAVIVLDPDVEYVTVKLAPVPVAGLPPGADHVKV